MISDLGTRLDWIGATWLTLLVLSWLFRWRSKVPGRFISLSGWLIIINGILILRWPRLLGFGPSLEVEYATRFIIYIISSYLQWYDWMIYLELTPQEKAKILEAVLPLSKRKTKKERKSLKENRYIEREKYDMVVAQLAALKREDEKPDATE